MKRILEEAKKFTTHQCMLMACVLSIFLPFYLGLLMMTMVSIALLLNGELKQLFKQTPQGIAGLCVCLIGTIGAVLGGNWLGLGCSLMILVLLITVYDLRAHNDAHFYDMFMKAILLMSLFCFGYALLEYLHITESLNYDFTDLIIADQPKYRVNSTFFNANYYAMMCEFFVLIALAKLISSPHKVSYILIILCNVAGLYLTGCRTAWVALAAAIPFLFYFLGRKRLALYTFCIELMLGGLIILEPDLMPRLENSDSSMETRIAIWQTAWQQFKHSPLLGEGPLTYLHRYAQYGGVPTQHAHNVFLDTLINFGLVGLVPLAIFLIGRLKEVFKTMDFRKGLAISMTMAVVAHGLMDVTIFWIQTSFLYLAVLLMVNGKLVPEPLVNRTIIE